MNYFNKWLIVYSSLLLLSGCSQAQIREVAEVVEVAAPVVGEAAIAVATSANPTTGLIMAGATILSALFRNKLKEM